MMVTGMLGWIGRCLFRYQGAGNREQGTESKLNPEPRTLNPERGSILILALWSLFFLGALAVAINACIGPRLNLAGKLIGRAKMHYLAKAGVEKAILEIEKDITGSCDVLKDSWSNNEEAFKEIEAGDGFFSVKASKRQSVNGEEEETRYGLVDEERKININRVPRNVLKNFFEIAGEIPSQDASDIADSIIDWRDEDDEPHESGAENGYYSMLNPGYPCKNGDFEVPEELLLVKGMTPEVFNKVKNEITVYGEGAVNINTAEELVLRALGMSGELVEKVIRFRKGDDGIEATGDDNVFEDAGAIANTLNSVEKLSGEEIAQVNKIFAFGLFSIRSDNFRGRSVGQLKNRSDSMPIVFVYDRNDKIMKYWRED